MHDSKNQHNRGTLHILGKSLCVTHYMIQLMYLRFKHGVDAAQIVMDRYWKQNLNQIEQERYNVYLFICKWHFVCNATYFPHLFT